MSTPKSKSEPKAKPKPVFGRLVRYVRPYSFWVAVTVIASLGLAAIDIVLGKLIERMIDGTIGPPGEIIAIIALMILIGMPCRYAIKYASARFSVKALQDLRSEWSAKITALPVSEVERRFTGDLVSRLTNDTAVLQNFFIQQFANLFYLPVVFLAAFTILLMTSWKLVLSTLVLLPLGMILTTLLTKPMQSFSEQLQESIGRLSAMAQDAIGGLAIIKAFNMQAAFYRKYSALMAEAVSLSLRLEKRYALLGPLAILFLASPIVFVIVYGGHLIEKGELDAGGIVLFIYLLNFVLQPVSLMPVLSAQIQEASGAARRLFEALDWPSERENGTSAALSVEAATPAVEFDRVTFSYDGETPALRDVSFRLERGETLAVVGGSGSGKSTLIKLLCGFYEPQPDSGTIRIEGRPLEAWNLQDLRSRMALVAQESYLFPASVSENIGSGREGATLEDIMEAAKSAGAHEFIAGLPEGYGTVLGERGGGLSGGQKQRIAIARALLKGAPLLLLDEPTSALDMQSEARVQEAIQELMKGRSVIVIAHRLSTIKQADRILVMEQGRIVESGTHEELMGRDGAYRKLSMYQNVHTEETEEEKKKETEHTAGAEGGRGRVLQAGVR
ncbi:ABC transporter ATP-binding protein [Paenibacillus mucilaginosus]|uniref:ABC transporter ATP-binding protein n=1 Tax=Paenibacillus mucilaginosus TaxID=61624 RepID=UPI00240CFB3C|nr:ABC transporter ATP-binding protein [Paenibacillus mucilaginosus]WFA19854.1 ABC transporter ATP-binding protein [Paenibacillus mucilaginosus]